MQRTRSPVVSPIRPRSVLSTTNATFETSNPRTAFDATRAPRGSSFAACISICWVAGWSIFLQFQRASSVYLNISGIGLFSCNDGHEIAGNGIFSCDEKGISLLKVFTNLLRQSWDYGNHGGSSRGAFW